MKNISWSFFVPVTLQALEIHQRTQDMLKMPTSLKLIYSLQKQHSKMHSWKYKKRISYAAEGHLLKY